jgi:hypothetical protein
MPKAAMASFIAELEKTAASDGHWRRLQPNQQGHGQGGEEIAGKTWVRRDRMRPEMKPMEHQADFTQAVTTQLKNKGGIIAAHGTGTGKTFTAINAFEKLKGSGNAKRALVITPAGLRENFLRKGVEKFTTSKAQIITKPVELSADVEYAIVSYAAFRQNPEAYIRAIKPDTIIADEVHRAANPEGATHKALLLARGLVPRFMGLTASIVQNHPQDVVPLLELAEGGDQEIKTKKEFRQSHIRRRPGKSRGIFGGKTYESYLIRQAALKASIGDTIHYVEDLDSSKKPTKDVTTVDVKMSADQMKLYRMSMKGIDPVVIKKIQEGEPVSQGQAMRIFGRLMRARQVSNSLHVATAGMTPAQAAKKTPKIKRILDDAVAHLADKPDAQIIMYTNMVHGGVDVLEAGLKARGVAYGVFAGKGNKGITEASRQLAVEKYLSGDNKVIIITGAGAEGLSLGNTTMVQLVDGHYNPERIAQAEARGIRAGGLSHRDPADRRVAVRRYVSAIPKTFWQSITFQAPKKSVGQWVYRTAEKKKRLNRQLRDVLQARTTHEKRQRNSWWYRNVSGRNP